MESNYRKRLIKIVTFLGGIYFFLEFVLPQSVLESIHVAEYHEQISYGFIVFGSMAVGLGLVNLFMVHGSRIIFRRKDWLYSIVLLIGLVVMMAVTGGDWLANLAITSKVQETAMLADFSKQIKSDFENKKKDVPAYTFRNKKLVEATEQVLATIKREAEDSSYLLVPKEDIRFSVGQAYQVELLQQSNTALEALKQIHVTEASTVDFQGNDLLAQHLTALSSTKGKLLHLNHDYAFIKRFYDFLYHGLFVALGSAMFSLLGVYIAAAAYRAFRIKSFESALMMSAAVIVMLGQIPFGLWIYDGLPDWRLWLMEVPNSAAFRAIKIGAAIAGLIMAFRMWFSIESESFSEK
ncbi:hypothetical protein OAO01_06480 [Oligoflexia bacterium]|nr:hypothetical protein [Oligoflexia bacterium]